MRPNLNINYPNAQPYNLAPGAGSTIVFCRQPSPGDVLQNIEQATPEQQPNLLSVPVGSPCVLRQLISNAPRGNTTATLGFTAMDDRPVFIPNLNNYPPVCPACSVIEDCPFSYEQLLYRYRFPQIAKDRVLKHAFERVLLALYENLGNQLSSTQLAEAAESTGPAVRKVLSREPFRHASCVVKNRGNVGGYQMPVEPLAECVGCAVSNLCVFPDYLKSLKM